MKPIKTFVPAVLALSALSACGGSGSGPMVTQLDNTLAINAQSDVPSDITAVLATLTTGDVTRTKGQLNRDDNSFDVGGLSGTYDSANDLITLTGGGTADLGLLQTYSGAALIEEAAGTRYGVYGIPASSIPSTGSASYAGGVELVIVDGEAVYELTGASEVSVLFAGDAVDVAFDNLDGQRTDGMGVQTDVTDVARINLNSASLTGSDYDGGLFSIASSTIGTYETGAETVKHAGALFGPGATEAGGAFTVDDTQTGSLLVQGAYTAD